MREPEHVLGPTTMHVMKYYFNSSHAMPELYIRFRSKKVGKNVEQYEKMLSERRVIIEKQTTVSEIATPTQNSISKVHPYYFKISKKKRKMKKTKKSRRKMLRLKYLRNTGKTLGYGFPIENSNRNRKAVKSEPDNLSHTKYKKITPPTHIPRQNKIEENYAKSKTK